MRVLIIEDDQLLHRAYRRMFSEWDVDIRDTVASAVDSIIRHPPDAIVSDVHIAGPGSGLDVFDYCETECPDIPFVFVTGCRPCIGIRRAPFLMKPCRAAEIIAVIERMRDVNTSQ